MLDLAIAGSTNAVLHLLAYSQELGLGLTLDDFDRIARRIKCLVGVVPSGRPTVIDLDRAGGVPAVMKRLETEVYTGETTLLGNTWGEYLTGVQVPDDSIIHPLQAPSAIVPACGFSGKFGGSGRGLPPHWRTGEHACLLWTGAGL